MASYKALQNKAMHKGAYIAYAVAGEHQWTTNGQIMVRHVAKPEELKPIKDQYDARVDGSSMLDYTRIIDTLMKEPRVGIASVGEDWENSKGLELVTITGYNQVDNETIKVEIQSVYIEYIMALYDIGESNWYVTRHGLFAVDGIGDIVAVVAKVKELNEEQVNETNEPGTTRNKTKNRGQPSH